MATPIIDHNLLTLDYWQDSVTYEGKTVPSGTIGCEALNIPDTLREKLAHASIPLQKIVAAIKENNLTAELLRPAKGSVLHMIQLAKDTLPFSRADAAYYNGRVEHINEKEKVTMFCTNPSAGRCVVPDIGGLRCEAVFRHACIGYRLRGKRRPAGKGHECQACR